MSKRKHPPARGAGGHSQTSSQTLRKSPADGPEVVPPAIVVNNNNSPERVLVDRFGRTHSRNVLKLWPDKVREVMGLRFVDRAELGATDAGVA